VPHRGGGGLSLNSQTETYPPSPYGDSLQRETKSSKNLSPLGGGSLQGGGGLSFNSPIDGVDNDTLRIYINPTQYFDQVPKVAWEFYIGGYQPAQKWLKDRKDQKLQFEDILHYQKIITTLTHTHHLMQEIEKIELE